MAGLLSLTSATPCSSSSTSTCSNRPLIIVLLPGGSPLACGRLSPQLIRVRVAADDRGDPRRGEHHLPEARLGELACELPEAAPDPHRLRVQEVELQVE